MNYFKLIFGLLIILAFLTVNVFAFADGTKWFVNTTSCSSYGANSTNSNGTLVAGIAMAAARGLPGDTIMVCNESGFYIGGANINFSINLVGIGRLETVNISSHPNEGNSVFNITAINVNITNLTINSSAVPGIIVDGAFTAANGVNINDSNITTSTGAGAINLNFTENVTIGGSMDKSFNLQMPQSISITAIILT